MLSSQRISHLRTIVWKLDCVNTNGLKRDDTDYNYGSITSMWLLKCDAKTCQILLKYDLLFLLALHKDIFDKKKIHPATNKILKLTAFFIDKKTGILLSHKNSVFYL